MSPCGSRFFLGTPLLLQGPGCSTCFSHLHGVGNGGVFQELGDPLHPLSLSSPCQTPRERQDLVQVELKGLVSSLGMWGPSCLPAYPLGVLREPSCAPGQLIILVHHFSSPLSPSISHMLPREEADTGHVLWVLWMCSLPLPRSLPSVLPCSPVIEQVGSPVEGAVATTHRCSLPCLPLHAYPAVPPPSPCLLGGI